MTKRTRIRWGLLGLILAVSCVPAQAQGREQAIRPDDFLYIEVFRVPELTTNYPVDPQGNINLPYVGKISVGGLTPQDAEQRIAGALQDILREPEVTVERASVGIQRDTGAGRTPQMQTELIPLQNSNAEELSASLSGMTSPGGNISFDENTNSLIVTDTPESIKNFMSVVNRLDQMQNQLTQVRIEAKIAEVRVESMKEMGIRWWVQGTDVLGGGFSIPRQDPSLNALRGGVTPFSNERVNGGFSGSQAAGTVGSVGGADRSFVGDMFDRRLNVPVQVPLPGQQFLGLLNDAVDIGALIDALVADNEAELLANPMTFTVNHKQARIKMTDEFPYFEFGTEITGATTVNTRFMDLGIILEVVPHVYQDSQGTYVKLELMPEVSFPVGSNNGVPIRSVRRSETTANVRDGQTLVIGGILREDERTFDGRMPGLGDLPIVGKLFSREETVKQRTELMIFVTPTVHRRPEEITWDKMIDVSDQLRDREMIPVAEIRGEERKD